VTRWTCDDDCGVVHATYEAAVKHAERRGSVAVEVASDYTTCPRCRRYYNARWHLHCPTCQGDEVLP
jgi:NMD protein affecting ribosome stability and mRNA decay